MRAPYRSAPVWGALSQRTPSQQQQGYQQRVKRVITSGNWVAGQVLTVQIPRNYDIETLYIFFNGQVAYPAALVAACVRTDAPYGIVNRVELIAEGRQTLFSVPGYVLGMNNIRRHKRATYLERAETFNNHQQPPLVYTSPTTSMPVSTTVNFAGVLCLDLQNIAGYRPKDTNLRSGGMQTLDLKITFGQLTDLFFPAASSVTPFAAPTLSTALPTLTGYSLTPLTFAIASSEMQEMMDASGKISSPTFTQRWSHQDINITTATNALDVQLPTDNFVSCVYFTSKIGGQSVDTVLNNITLKRGVDVRYNMPISVQRALGQFDYDWSLMPGHYCADLIGSGNNNVQLSQTWNLQGGADTRATLDVTNAGTTTTVGITTCEMIPLRQG